MRLQIIQYGDPVLTKRADEVNNIDGDLVDYMLDMLDTMREADGIGLAAPQVSRSICVLVMSDTKREWTMVNPKIIGSKGNIVMEEGCLSLPGIFIPLSRAKTVEVEYHDDKGRHEEKLDDLAARVFCTNTIIF